MKNKLTLYVLTMLIAIPTTASEWIDVGTSSDKLNSYYIDKDSIQEKTLDGNSVLSAFIQVTYLKKHPNRIKTGIYYSKQHWYISCDNRSFIIDGWIDYNTRDIVIDSVRNPINYSYRDWHIVYPDTIGESIINTVCSEQEDISF